MPWIRTDERLPDPGERVLVTDGYAVFEMYRKAKDGEYIWVRPADYTIPQFECVWWRRMPEPPERKGD